MAITEIKQSSRPNTSVAWFYESGHPAQVAAFEAGQPFRDAGKHQANGELNVVSNNGLTLTRTQIFEDLETYSAIDTLLSIELDAAFVEYNSVFGSYGPGTINTYQQLGIESPFRCTTKYTFPADATEIKDLLVDAAETDAHDKLHELRVTETTITMIHHYDNSEDFTAHSWSDIRFARDMHQAGFTRTIRYEYLS